MIKQTEIFSKWLLKLKDTKAKVATLRRVQEGNFGDYKSISLEISELRITTGPGYRVDYTKTEDILKAKKIAKELKDD